MLGLFIWVLAFAYGRMTPELSWKPFAVLAVAAAVISYLIRSPEVPDFAINFIGNFVLGTLLFLLGYGFGRWRDAGKDSSRFSD